MCNPRVRPHLHFYPEDSGQRLEETRQASNWLHEMSPEDTTPMIRVDANDYYIYEPAMLNNGTFCIPYRWFTRGKMYWARAWALELKRGGDQSSGGWIVRKDVEIDVPEEVFLKNFLQLSDDHKAYGVPHPSCILGNLFSFLCCFYGSDFFLGVHSNIPSHPEPFPWTHTNPADGNRWRKLSKGRRTLFLPLWLYCDDTSGNQSKKWNEHNSFLFTLAGLPREEVSKQYNIHFLCTSNLAPPLEMLDGVVEQLK